MLKHKILSSLAISSLLLFSGCGKEGHLIDSAIGNVKYTVDSKDYTADYTDTDGTFIYDKEIKYISFIDGRIIYKKNKTITFTIGDLIIAKDFDLSKINDDGKILPADIVGVDRNNTTDERIIKLIRVLQSLDSDNNASNGIFIDDNTKGYLGTELNIIDENISTLKTMVEDAGKVFISQRKAREHYIQKLRDMGIEPILSPFVTVWKTNPTDKEITIPTNSNYSYNYTIEWGDGAVDKNINNSITHTYNNIGNHIVKISGKFPAIRMVTADDFWKQTTQEKINAEKLQKVTQWGDIVWSSFHNSFAKCSNFNVNATDIPNLTNVHSTKGMFSEAKNLKGNKYFNDWDVSSVVDMSYMFYETEAFNQPLNNWNVSSVTGMSQIFYRAKAFNQSLSKWNVSSVTDMSLMFCSAKAFNQPLNKWNVSSVTDMSLMFWAANAFNQPLNNWEVSSVTDMSYMFWNAKAFNQPLNNWEVSSATDTSGMFYLAKVFNQPLNNWNISNVTNMSAMFFRAKAFNQPLNNWDVSSVTNMHGMFYEAEAFNQTLNNWDVSNVTDMSYMFYKASTFTNQDLSSWNVGNVPSTEHSDFMLKAGGGNTQPNWK
jgi:surface protein